MDIKTGDSLKTSRVTEWTVNQGGYLPISFGGFLIFGCVLAYAIAVLRGNVDPFLPLISDAAGSPPQNGLFGTLICIGGILGVFFMFLRYLIVLEQNQDKSRTVGGLNKVSLAVGIASMCGITLITGYPANFYRDKDVWLNHVGIPHMMGGVVLFALGLLYIAMQCILTLYLRSKQRFMLLLRVALCLAATAAFVHHVITVPDNFGGVKMALNASLSGQEGGVPMTQGSVRDLKLHIDMGGTYISSAISQWLLMLLFCSFFFTFFKEVQEYSLLIVIETNDPDLDVNAEVAADDYGDKDGPSTYTRKTSQAYSSFPSGISYDAGDRRMSKPDRVRRDSSCQTREEMFPNDIPYTNGSSKVAEKAQNPTGAIKKRTESGTSTEDKRQKEQIGDLRRQTSVANGSSLKADENSVVCDNANGDIEKTEHSEKP